MPIPQNVTDAMNKLAADRDELDGEYAAKTGADVALAAAQNTATVAGNALASGVSNFESDKSALVSLINSAFTSGPPSM